MRLRLGGEQRIYADHGALPRLLQLRQEGAGRVDHREELQLQLLQPRRVLGAGEGRHAALAGVVDQHVHRAKFARHVGGEGVDLRGLQHVAPGRVEAAAGEACAQRGLGLAQPLFVTAAHGHGGAGFQQQFDGRQPDAGGPAGHDGYLAVELNHGHRPHSPLLLIPDVKTRPCRARWPDAAGNPAAATARARTPSPAPPSARAGPGRCATPGSWRPARR
ncbi:hypothetical protein D3C86_1493810 [compost metagenome]